MLEKGTMITAKKIMGIILIIIGAAYVLNIQQVLSAIKPCEMAVGILMAVAGYFLFISGRQLR